MQILINSGHTGRQAGGHTRFHTTLKLHPIPKNEFRKESYVLPYLEWVCECVRGVWHGSAIFKSD